MCDRLLKKFYIKPFQLYFDMIYGVNKIELGINDILQLIEVTLGEGELLKCTIKRS